MIVRKYQSNDFAAVIALYTNPAAFGGVYDETRDEVDRLLATSEQGNLLVTEVDSQVVGSVMILDNPHSFWLLRFVVDPEAEEYDRVAESLMDAASRIAKQRGHESLIVYTDPSDSRLNDRYSKLGCRKGGRYQCYWREV